MPSEKESNQMAGAGIMMILSPAKTLNLEALPATDSDQIPSEEHFTWPDCDIEKTKEVARAMKQHSAKSLGKLLAISDKLAHTSHRFWQDFEDDSPDKRSREEMKPAIYSFSGAAYQGLQAYEAKASSILYLQDNLRIVDGVYGLLRPLDCIQPYRLEMATRNIFGKEHSVTKLNEYWKSSITKRLAAELKSRQTPILLNLASDEYAAGVDAKELENEGVAFVKIVFRHQGRVIAVHAKRARGLMARYLADIGATTLKDVMSFDWEGYTLDEKASDDKTLVFDRRGSPTNATVPNSKPTKRKLKEPDTAKSKDQESISKSSTQKRKLESSHQESKSEPKARGRKRPRKS